MIFNPTAIALWAFLGIVAYLIGGTLNAALIGVAIGLALSIIGDLATKK